ncbi:histidine kinase [Paenibacillus sp. IB182496]|uniref:Histidine kinase n=1 Tax=Paenibacillus sabuli TaxID=2772509 RepID=A0A927BQT0_9BACL|nr:histidine kinase [Paenibacillus sabuli]MBD2844055.1 histidine kinase [Paenibacillus sabuli]
MAGFTMRLTIFHKLLGAFLLVIAPLFAIGYLLYEQGADAVRSEISESMRTKVHFYVDSLEREIKRIGVLQQEYVLDRDLSDLSVWNPALSDLQRTQAIQRVYERLSLMQHSSKYIAETSVYIPAIGASVSTGSYYDNDSEGFYTRLDEHYCEHPASIVLYEGELFMIQRYPAPGLAHEPNFLLVNRLSKAFIQEELRQFGSATTEVVLIGTDTEWAVSNISLSDSRFADNAPPDWLTSGSEGFRAERIDEIKVILAWETAANVPMALMMIEPEHVTLGPLQRFKYWLLVLFVVSLLVIASFSIGLIKLIHEPLKKIVVAFRSVEKGNLDIIVGRRSNDEFKYLYTQFNSMIVQLKKLIREIYEHQYRLQRSELKLLQSQINPHFLYNSFFILNEMAEVEDLPKLKVFTRHLGRYFHFITRHGRDEVSLNEELAFTSAYIQIQLIRFGDRITVEIGEMPESCRDLMVPRIMLQPLVENAFKYGVEPMEKEGQIKIGFMLEDDIFVIRVEDNGDQMTKLRLAELQESLRIHTELAESTGLINVHSRLLLKYGEGSGATLTSGERGGLRVELRIPLTEDHSEHSKISEVT